jgi:hypothetical protein
LGFGNVDDFQPSKPGEVSGNTVFREHLLEPLSVDAHRFEENSLEVNQNLIVSC